MANYVKKYLEAFEIFSKYKDLYGSPEFDYGWMCLYFAEEFSPEDHSRLIELGWEAVSGSIIGYCMNS
jgi:hypothetical protein